MISVLHDATIESIDNALNNALIKNEEPAIVIFSEQNIENLLEYYNCKWYNEHKTGSICWVTSDPVPVDYQFASVHVVTDRPLDEFIPNVTIRLVALERNVEDLFDYVSSMVQLGYRSIIVQRVQVDESNNGAYIKNFKIQWMLINRLIRPGIRINQIFPDDMYDEENYFFDLKQPIRIYKNGRVTIRNGQQKKDLLVVPVIMTEACNLNCKYCYVTYRNRKDFCTISSDILKDIPGFLERYADEFTKIRLDLFGGEPLLQWPKCKELIEHMQCFYDRHPNSIDVYIFTNATLITEDILDYVKTKPYVQFHFSMDGGKDSNNKTRLYAGGQDTYEDIQKSIDLYCKKFNKTRNDLAVNFVVSPDNVAELYESVVEIYNMGQKSFSMNVVKEDVWTPETLEIYKEQYKKVADFIVDKLTNGELFYSRYFFEVHAFKSVKNKPLCPACHSTLGIGPDGKIYPCQRFFNNRSGYAIGNLKDGVDASNEIYRKIKSFPHGRTDKCKGCVLEEICQYHCFAAQYEIGSMYEYIESNCTIDKYNYVVGEEMCSKLDGNKLYERLMPTVFGDCCGR